MPTVAPEHLLRPFKQTIMNPVSPAKKILVVGGGIVGLATAHELLTHRDADPDGPGDVVVLEAKSSIADGQSGHNSGVLHSGIYYPPGSLKARLCRRGKTLLESFCDDHGVAYDRCGKVIVATTSSEIHALNEIERRGRANGVVCHRIHTDELRDIEPHAAGVDALHVPKTGIVDYRRVCECLRKQIRSLGGEVRTDFEVNDIVIHGDDEVTATSTNRSIAGTHLINCGGLYCDRIAKLAGVQPSIQIVPFRGEYYTLREDREHLCRGLIYPVPDPSFPFLGVHLTRDIDGGVHCGPNAVMAFGREGYRWNRVSPRDLFETVSFRGFRKLAWTHWKTGIREMGRSLSKKAFARSLQKLVPEVTADDLIPSPAGVRAQAVRPDGELVDDFVIQSAGPTTHVLNAPSPAATASMAIAEEIVRRSGLRKSSRDQLETIAEMSSK